jgi:uncharacterized protein
MVKSRRSPFVLVLPVLLAAALLLPATAPAAERTVAVGADVTLKVANDTAGIGLSARAEKRSRGAALKAVSARLRKVIAAVQAIPGVGDGDIRSGRISVGRSFRGEVPVYSASQGIGVTLHEPGRAGEAVSAAIAAGASGVSGPAYYVGDTDAAETNALAAAFRKAQVKAAALAAQTGGTLGPALVIEEGDIGGEFATPELKGAPAADCGAAASPAPTSTTRRAATKCASAAPPPTKPGTSTVTASVRVIFALL